MKVVFRADASSLIGTGHVMRCKALADVLKDRGADVRFVCRDHSGNMIPLLQDTNYPVTQLPAPPRADSTSKDHDDYAAWLGVDQATDASQTIEALKDFHPDWLIVDHYGLDKTWETTLRPHADRIFAIDDLAQRMHDSDFLLDQNWFGVSTGARYEKLIPEKCVPLLGPRYALLQYVFGRSRKNLSARPGRVQRVLLFFGGVDSGDQTSKALQALSSPRFHSLAVDVVIGDNNANAEKLERLAATRPRTVVHRRLPNLAALMMKADLMLGAGGTTTWERCCLGLPGLVVALSENQKEITEALAREGFHKYLGEASHVGAEDWTRTLEELIENPDQVRLLSEASLRLTDGLGALRVAAVLENKPMTLTMRPASSADEGLLLEWANDPETRRFSFSPEPIAAETHRDWFRKKLQDPRCVFYVGEDAYGLPAGQVRFDLREEGAVIDVSVDPVLRGRGCGVGLLRQAAAAFRKEGHEEPLVAQVLAINQPSRKMFERAGFKLASAVLEPLDVLHYVLTG